MPADAACALQESPLSPEQDVFNDKKTSSMLSRDGNVDNRDGHQENFKIPMGDEFPQNLQLRTQSLPVLDNLVSCFKG